MTLPAEIGAVLEGRSEGCAVNADCLDVLPLVPAQAFDLVVADPPYFLPAVHYQTRKVFRRSFCDLGILEHWVRDLFTNLQRVLKPDGYLYVFCDGQSYPLFYYHAYGFTKSVRPLIWDKLVSINGYGWRHQHEIILYAEMPETKPIPTGDGDILDCRAVPVETRLHPAEKPVELLTRITQKHTGIMLDPCCGSAATCRAAQLTGMAFVGLEVSPEYCEIARARLAAVDTAVPVREQRAGQMALFGTGEHNA